MSYQLVRFSVESVFWIVYSLLRAIKGKVEYPVGQDKNGMKTSSLPDARLQPGRNGL